MTISSFLVTYVSHVPVFPPQSNAYIYFIIFSTRVHTVFHCTLIEMRDHPASEHFQVDSDVKLVDVKVFKSAGVFFFALSAVTGVCRCSAATHGTFLFPTVALFPDKVTATNCR